MNKKTTKYSFSKSERLKKRSVINQLFKKSRAVTAYPIRALFLLTPLELPDQFPVKAGVSASKKRFAKAVQRNHLKRLLRECYRLQKHTLAEYVPPKNELSVMFLYIGKEEKPDFHHLSKSMKKCMEKIGKQIQDTHPDTD